MNPFFIIQIHVNEQQTFFLNEHIISTYSESLKKMITEEKRRKKSSGIIEMDELPGGANGFELVSRFCYNNGRIRITVSNVCALYCCALYLRMRNLLKQTDSFLEGMFKWPWKDLITSLKSCESFLIFADSCHLIHRLLCPLLLKITQNSDLNLIASSSSSEASTPKSMNPCSSRSRKEWWFDDLTALSPMIIQKIIQSLGAYGTDNKSLILTRFLLHYLKSCVNSNISSSSSEYFGGLIGTAVHGVTFAGKSCFSCRKLFGVLKIVSGFGVSKECRGGLEKMIGGMLEQATLDDLLACSSGGGRGFYDVNLVLKLIRIFVLVNSNSKSNVGKMKMVGRLIDKYLGEISPDHNLKVSKFTGVAESLPDYARDCFDVVYRAVDIYLQSHPNLSFQERSRLCGCLNYAKLSLEACKDLAKNPRIPPNVAVQALVSQAKRSNLPINDDYDNFPNTYRSPSTFKSQMVLYNSSINDTDSFPEENETMKLNLQKMQWRVMELEKELTLVKLRQKFLSTPTHNHGLENRTNGGIAARNTTLPRLC